MTTQHDKAKRWQPRFSVRTLAIIVTLVCCYFGAWEATNRHGVPKTQLESAYTKFSHAAGEKLRRQVEAGNHDGPRIISR